MMLKELNNILEIAEKSLLENKNGELILPIRKKIWRELGMCKDINNLKTKITLGQKRRVELALLCVYKVLDIWKNNIKNDDRPEKILQKSKEYIEGKCDVEVLDKVVGRFQTDLDDMMLEENDYIIAVGQAVYDVVLKAKHDEVLLLEDRSEDELDDDLDCWDASYDSADAYAGGGKWQEKSNPEKRREFWMWYIKDAVPQAYSTYVK